MFVIFGELATWTDLRGWGSRRRQELADWLSGVPVLPGDEAVAATWGKLSAGATRAGQPRPVNDMWIAACYLTHNLPLTTMNLKDYTYFIAGMIGGAFLDAVHLATALRLTDANDAHLDAFVTYDKRVDRTPVGPELPEPPGARNISLIR